MTRHRLEVVAAFVLGLILALGVASPAAGRPGWFCERKPAHPACQSPSTTLAATGTVTPPTTAPTAAPASPVQTPAPTVSVTPGPTSSPARPFPAPVTSRTVTAPASGDISAWLDGVGNGVVVEFPASATYNLSRGFLLQGRSNVVLDGNGATLNLNTSGSNSDPAARASAFMLKGSHDIAIRDFRVIGNNPDTTRIFVPGNEGQHVLSLNGWYSSAPSWNVEMDHVTASHVYTDLAYLEGQNSGTYPPSHHVWIHHNESDFNGRMTVAFINVTDVWVEDNSIDKVGLAPFDIEPNFAAESVERVIVRRNAVGSFGHSPTLAAFFFTDVPGGNVGATVTDVTVTGNAVAGNPSTGFDGSPRALHSKFIATGGVRHRNIVFTDNTTSLTVSATFGSGGVFYFSGIDGVTLTRNVQPITSGSTFARFDSCTGVVQ